MSAVRQPVTPPDRSDLPPTDRIRLERRSAINTSGRRRERITMLLENNPYPQDPRVRHEAESLVAAGHSVLVVAPRRAGQQARERINGVDVQRFRAIDWSGGGGAPILAEYVVACFALNAAALRALVRGHTVLHLHNPPDIFFLAGAIFRLARRTVVFDHHDLGPELAEVRFGRGPLVSAARISERLTFAVASHVLAANQSHAEIARGRGHMSSDEVTVVRNGPPASWTRLPMGLREGELAPVRLAYLGTVAEQDGLDGIVEVLVCLRDRTPAIDAVLTVIGDGSARHKFEEALGHAGLAGTVTITGWVASDRVPALLQDADVCVDPAPPTALNERSTMIKLMEYLALGKPVVAYDLLETRRTVRDAALLVRPGDVEAFAEQIAMLAHDPELRSRLAKRARDRGRELTWERSESELLTAYAGFGEKAARSWAQRDAATPSHRKYIAYVGNGESGQSGAAVIPDDQPSLARRAARSFVPGRFRQALGGVVRPLRYRGDAVHCACCNGDFSRFIPHQGRPFAKCPRCGALERHRLLVSYLRDQTDVFSAPLKVLHVAPEWCLQRVLRRLPNLDYVSADLDSPLATDHVDLLDLPYPSGAFDLVLCNHVLEHVDDDLRALDEIRRVLSPGGRAIMMSPIDGKSPSTIEDPNVKSEEDRLRLYWQRDHVRRYGRDFAARVESRGFSVETIRYIDRFDAGQVERQGLRRESPLFSDDDIFMCRAATR